MLTNLDELAMKDTFSASSASPLSLDKDGFLQNQADWNPQVAEQLAMQENLHLSAAHWEVIQCIREYYTAFDHAPAMRPLSKYLSIHLGKDKSGSIYLLQLFPGSPAKLAAKVAGLPKPPNCL